MGEPKTEIPANAAELNPHRDLNVFGINPNTSRGRWTRHKADVAYAAIGLFLFAFSVARLIPTYPEFNGTSDEPYHIACGLEWLANGKVVCEAWHPPLARIAVALGPYLAGLRANPIENKFSEGNDILYSDGHYWRNLTLARLGNLPFLALGSIVILLWARRWYTRSAGIWALLLFLSLPPVLGHAGLATQDLACTATVAACLYLGMRWWETPGWWLAAALGAALALAILSKFSTIGFLAACCAAATILLLLRRQPGAPPTGMARLRLGQACLLICSAFFVLWAGYRFTVGPLAKRAERHSIVDRAFGPGTLTRIAYKAVEIPIPLHQIPSGLIALWRYSRTGTGGYLLGSYSTAGWLGFYPVAVVVKTPLGFLLLGLGGLAIACWNWRRTPWQQLLTALFPVVILTTCLTSRLNLGVRYALPIYIPLAIAAGSAVSHGLSNSRRVFRIATVALACSVAVDSLFAHPDYLAWFNQLSGKHPERILCDSDLDWGQDLHRLSRRLKELGAKRVTVGYFFATPLSGADLPEYTVLSPTEKAVGWVAAEVRLTNLEYARNGSYGWLKHYQPLERIGKSIDLYRIDQ